MRWIVVRMMYSFQNQHYECLKELLHKFVYWSKDTGLDFRIIEAGCMRIRSCHMDMLRLFPCNVEMYFLGWRSIENIVTR